MCRAVYRPNVHLVAAKDAIKKALTVYENVVRFIALYHQFMMSSRSSLGASGVYKKLAVNCEKKLTDAS
jgi:hypothetical protein